MAHIHTDPGQHDLTISAYIVRLGEPEPTVLLHMHRKLHKWMQFGGHVELHENPWQALAREIQEESGYKMEQLKLLQPNIKRPIFDTITSHPWPAVVFTGPFGDLDHYHTDLTYAFTTTQEPRGAAGDGESQELRGFARSELVAMNDDEIMSDVRIIALTIFDDYLKTWQQVEVPRN